LATTQSSPTQRNWDDGLWLLRYINGRRGDRLVLTACGINPEIEVFCDASHNQYADGKGHSGISVFIGNCKAAVYNKSNKIKCTTASSTDAEIICMSSGVLIGDFFRLFLADFGNECSVVYFQDNDSSALLMRNGTRNYAGKKNYMVVHINSISEYLEEISNNARIVRMGTGNMIADIHTKNLRGEVYFEFNSRISGNY